MNTSRKGNQAERDAAHSLEADGYLVASRRHVGGAGDLVAVPSQEALESRPLLIEVKTTKAGAWAAFGPADRKELADTAIEYGMIPALMWRGKPSAPWRIFYSSDWPRQ